jgi:PAS domain-containing protein
MIFKKENNGYKVRAGIRESIVFAQQSDIKDPPFTKLELICSRNLLIYLDSELQKRLLPLFHHSLNPKGMLFLGASDTIGEFTTLFASLNDKWKIYQRKAGTHSQLQPMDFPFPLPKHEPQGVPIKKYMDITALAERTLLDDNLCIRRFSANAERIVELLETDVGRPFKQLSSKVLDVDLVETAQHVIDSRCYVEKEVQTQNGHVYLMRVLTYPYMRDQRLCVVFTFVNIKELKGMTKKLQFVEDAWRFAEGIIETVRDPLIVLDQNMKIITASKSFHRLFQISEKTVEGKSLYDLGAEQLDIP